MHTATNNQGSGNSVLTNPTTADFDNYASVLTHKTKQFIQLLSGRLALSLGLSMLAANPAAAASFSFTKIADTQNDFTTISSNGAAINDSATVAFVATPNNTQQGVYTSDGTAITEIINTTALPSLFSRRIDTTPVTYSFGGLFGPSLDINNNGTVAFIAGQSNLQSDIDRIILVAQGSSITTRGSGSISRVGGENILELALNNLDELAYLNRASFRSGFSNYRVVLTRENQPDVTIFQAVSSSPAPIADLPPLIDIQAVDINNTGEVTFATTRRIPPTDAIFTNLGGEPTSLVETDASALSVNDNGDIVLSNQNRDALRLFNRTSGTLQTIADTTSSSLRTFGTPAINNNGQVAFTATLNSGSLGIFTGADPIADKVIATGDLLFGSTVTNLNFLRSGLNNNGQIAFFAQLADGTQGIYRADLITDQSPKSVPESASSIGLAAFAVLGLGSLRQPRLRSPAI